MGMPFSTAVNLAARESKTLVSWAWAVNGGASVFGSTLSVLVSMTYGFTASLLGGALAYGSALAAVTGLSRTVPAAASLPARVESIGGAEP
jgi:hypothetical protein